MARILVVGTGIAGLVASLEASRRHDVVLVTKAELAEGSTRYAQGGIAAAMFPDDSVAAHIADTIRAGAGVNDKHAVQLLCEEGPGRIRDLIALGVEFDREGGELARGHEAAHSARRVLHAGGDATGLAIETALLTAVRRVALEVYEHTFMSDLIVESGRVVGVDVIGPDGGTRRLDADIVVLASGGAGQLFRHTTNPVVATGDGVAAALRAGASLRDLEFYQFHPTSLAVPGNHLISEAVRGEGAELLDASGRRFMLDVHPDAELAPRDVLARAIAAQMTEQGGRPVLLDATALGSAFLTRRFPGISRVCAANGLDWARQPIPVTPAAHYWMGGIRTDDVGRTSIPGLVAVGEVACTGAHGANRLASNSLLESLVFAWRAASALGSSTGIPQFPTTDAVWQPSPDGHVVQPDRTAVPFDRRGLQDLMWRDAGLARSAVGLTRAAGRLAAWSAARGSITSGASRWTPTETASVARREDANLLDLARVLVAAAMSREETRGAHSRVDFPESPSTPDTVSVARKVPAPC